MQRFRQTVPGFGSNLTRRLIRQRHDQERTTETVENISALGELAMSRILIVDDDPTIRSAVCTWLEDKSFEVVVKDGAESGLDAIGNNTFDLMIIDIFMPHMSGFEAVRVFHQRAPTVPLIAFSGYVFANDHSPAPDFLSVALELGAARCLRKPFTSTTLPTVIETCLSEARAHRKHLGRHP
jgi:CheY-like chemotaxis protein